MIALTRRFGRYGYRRVAALLRDAGWHVNDKRVERLWRREGLKVPMKQAKRGRLWLNDGSCIRLKPERKDHVWSYDFVHHRTDDGRAFRTLNILMVAQGETRFACVCYGNVVGSRDSVVPYFKRLSSNGSKTRPSLMNKIIQSAKDMLLTL